MTNTYKVSWMTCIGSQAKVKHLLSTEEGVKNIEISLQTSNVTIEMDQHISTSKLKAALAAYPNYQIGEEGFHAPSFWVDMSVWKKAGKSTLNCLIRCSIGDFAMITYLQSY
jgi:copper chaperone CopZ